MRRSWSRQVRGAGALPRRRAVLGAVAALLLAACGGEQVDPPNGALVSREGRTCEGWVSVEAVEAALGAPIDELRVEGRELRRWPETTGLECAVRHGETRLYFSVNGLLPGEADHPERNSQRHLRHPDSSPGPLPDSAIGPGTPEGSTTGLAVLEFQGDDHHEVAVNLAGAPDGVDVPAAVARVLEEVADTASATPPGPHEGSREPARTDA